MSIKITIPGRPATKKNSQRIVYVKGRPIIIQSATWKEYEKFCIGTKRKPGWLMQWGNVCYTTSVHVCAQYWMPDRRSWPDLCGLFQGTGDVLQDAGIIANDKLITSWDGSRIMGVDKDNPRVDITITEARE